MRPCVRLTGANQRHFSLQMLQKKARGLVEQKPHPHRLDINTATASSELKEDVITGGERASGETGTI